MPSSGAVLQGDCGQGAGVSAPRHECLHPGSRVQHPCSETARRGGHEGAWRPYFLPAEGVSAPWFGTQEQCRNQGGVGKTRSATRYGHLRCV